jgi:hypothetical protein
MALRILLSAALAFLGLAATAPAQAKELVLAPSSPWNIDYATDSCALRRTFGEGEQKTLLEMRRFAPDNVLQTTVASGAARLGSGSFNYRFDPDKKQRSPHFWHHLHFDGGQQGVIFGLALEEAPLDGLHADDLIKHEQLLASHEFLDREAQTADRIASISIAGAFTNVFVLKTGSLKAPLLAMRTCTDELRRHWGIDVDAQAKLTRPAVPINRASVRKMMDYPPKMLARGMPGLVNLRLAIDERGNITGCFIQMPLSDPAFEKSACADLEHALDFEPALDQSGKPVASYWVTVVDFRID